MEPCQASGSSYLSAYHGSLLSPTGLRGVKSPRQKMKGRGPAASLPRAGVEEPGGSAHRHQAQMLGSGWRIQLSCIWLPESLDAENHGITEILDNLIYSRSSAFLKSKMKKLRHRERRLIALFHLLDEPALGIQCFHVRTLAGSPGRATWEASHLTPPGT